MLLWTDHPRPRRFYLLPKIHKDPAQWNKPFQIPPGCPIVSDCNSETYQTSELLEYYLNPIPNKHRSYIKDSSDFLEKILKLQLPIGCFLFTIDMDSLNTNIDTKLCIKTIQKGFNKYPESKSHLI